VEHIMPLKLSAKWRSDLGGDWKDVHDTWLNTLANLTLTTYNQKYSNHTFVQKKNMPDGFAKSPLPLNTYIAEFDVWNEQSLKKRAKWLSTQIGKIWKYPETTLPVPKNEDDGERERYSPSDWEIKSREKPATVLINDEEFDVISWVDLYTKVLSFVQENYYDKFVELIDDKDLLGDTDKPFITKKRDILSTAGELGHDTFFECAIGVYQIIKNINKICDHIADGNNEDNCLSIEFTLA